ncbi:hypothetical protein EDB84DRAFT_133157 [Lactarius hengduanensis]|nr:hypothetical protein EDB84DRAFT_133157 [Lactarius hengduanensis]
MDLFSLESELMGSVVAAGLVRFLLDRIFAYRACLGHPIGRGDNLIENDAHAAMILEYMQTFRNDKEEFMVENTITNIAKGRSGYGSAPLTVSIYNFDPALGCDDATFQPCSPRALSSLKVVGDRCKELYPLSRNSTSDQPRLLRRGRVHRRARQFSAISH